MPTSFSLPEIKIPITVRSHDRCLCFSPECKSDSMITFVQEQLTDHFSITSMVPSGPHIQLFSEPFMFFVEYVVQIGSYFGT